MSFEDLLKPEQKEVLYEAKTKQNGGMSLKMGYGKTLISIILALETCEDGAILVVCSKSLINNWINEIKKFFGGSLPFAVLHSEYVRDTDSYSPPPNTKIIITTPQVTLKYYKKYGLENQLIQKKIVNEGKFGQHETIEYNHIRSIDPHNGLIYGTQWGVLIIDEFQEYMNITVDTCRSILSIVADHKWALSGTLFDEPKPEKIMAYFFLIDDPNFPKTLPDAKEYLRSPSFTGVNPTLVIREDAPFIVDIEKHLITVPFKPEEEMIFQMLRGIFLDINIKAKELKNLKKESQRKNFSGFILTMLIYIRQGLVNPINAFRSLVQSLDNVNNSTELREIIWNYVKELNLDAFVNNPQNLISSKIKAAIDLANQHNKVIIFTDFRSNVDILLQSFPGRHVFTIEGNMPAPKRAQIIQELERIPEFVLILTYQIGSSGLNLQVANTVILLDYTWNQSDTSQAIARVARQGQGQKVNIYYLLSNTGFENNLFKKHIDKTTVKNELATGAIKSKISTIGAAEIVELFEEDQIIERLQSLALRK